MIRVAEHGVRPSVELVAAFDRVFRAQRELARGNPIVVCDDSSHETEANLVLSAELATTSTVSFMIRYSSGFVSVALRESDCHRMQLPVMCRNDGGRAIAAYAVSVDSATNVTTGISASDRAQTIRTLADPLAGPASLTRPGHVLPVHSHDGGLLARCGIAEAAVDLAGMAGVQRAAAMAGLVSERNPIHMADAVEGADFAQRHNIAAVSIDDVLLYRRMIESQVQQTFTHDVGDAGQTIRIIGYQSSVDYGSYIVRMPVSDGARTVTVECVPCVGQPLSVARVHEIYIAPTGAADLARRDRVRTLHGDRQSAQFTSQDTDIAHILSQLGVASGSIDTARQQIAAILNSIERSFEELTMTAVCG